MRLWGVSGRLGFACGGSAPHHAEEGLADVPGCNAASMRPSRPSIGGVEYRPRSQSLALWVAPTRF